jgi:hypothetical protein
VNGFILMMILFKNTRNCANVGNLNNIRKYRSAYKIRFKYENKISKIKLEFEGGRSGNMVMRRVQ